MKIRNLFVGATSACFGLLLGSCSSNPVGTVTVLDKAGGAIQGAYEYPILPFGNHRRSGFRGKLNVWTQFPVIVADGYEPVLVEEGVKDDTIVTLTRSEPKAVDERSEKLLELAARSRELAGVYYRTEDQ